MEYSETIDEFAPIVESEDVALSIATSDLFDRGRRFSLADRIPDQSLQPIERIDRDRLVLMRFGGELGKGYHHIVK